MPAALTPPTLPADSAESHRDRLVNALASGVAHEFNNVLQIVHGYVAFARDSLPASSVARDDLEHALVATDRAASLSRRMLQLARGRQATDRADVADAIDALRVLLRPILGQQIELTIDADAALPPISGSDNGLRESLLNLAINARDAMPDGGRLRVTAKKIDREGSIAVLVSVEDSGPGVSPGLLDSVFDPFVSTKAEGAGLGLALVQRYAEEAGGEVSVCNRVDGGARFELLLPAAVSRPYGSHPRPTT